MFSVALLMAGTSSLAQVSFKASASKSTVARNEEFTVSFEVNQATQRFTPPSFGRLRVTSGPNQSVSTVGGFGTPTSHTESISYTLRASKAGRYTIGSAGVIVNGKTYKSEPFVVTVSNSGPQNTNPKDPQAIAAKSVKIRINTSKTTVYQGEPVIASFDVYFKTQISAPRLLEEPDYTGFYKENIDPVRISSDGKRVLENQEFNYAVVNRRLLLPQRSGTFKLGNVDMNIPTSIPSNQRDFFGRQVTRTINFVASTTFPSIMVLPLPESNKPSNFNGAVGQYKMDVDVSRSELTADESLTLKITLSGSGNIKLVEIPEPEFPSAFEAYDPKYSENIKTDINGMRGKKTFEYLLIPRYGGTYKIPAIEFSYFDTQSKKYKTLRSDNFELTVTGGPSQPKGSSTVGGFPSSGKEDVKFINKDILFIKTKDSDLKLKGEKLFPPSGFYIGIFIPILGSLVMIVLFLFKNNRSEDQTKVKQGKAGKLATKQLLEAKKMLDLNDRDGFYLALSSALLGYFSDKLSLGKSQLNQDTIQEELLSRTVNKESISKAIDMMNRADLARFTSASSNLASDYEHTAEVITDIEKQLT